MKFLLIQSPQLITDRKKSSIHDNNSTKSISIAIVGITGMAYIINLVVIQFFVVMFGFRSEYSQEANDCDYKRHNKGYWLRGQAYGIYLQNTDCKLTCTAYVHTSSNINGSLSINLDPLQKCCFFILTAFIACIFSAMF